MQLFKNGRYFDIFISKLDWIFHRIIGQFRLEGTPRRSLVQCTAWSRVSCGNTPAHSGFYSTNSWKYARAETSQPLQTTVKMFSPTSNLNLSSISFLLLSCFPTMHHCEKSEFVSTTTQSCLLSKTEQAPVLHPFTGQVKPHRQPPYWWPSKELAPVWNIERSLGRKNILIKYFTFTEKKSLKMFLFCFVLKICIFSILVGTKLPFSHRLLFQTHHIVPNPALFVQLYLQIQFYNWLSYRVFKEWISEQKSLRHTYKVVQFIA